MTSKNFISGKYIKNHKFGKYFFALFVMMLISLPQFTQNFPLQIIWLDTDSTTVAQSASLETNIFHDSIAATGALSDMIDELHQNWYWEASVDTLLCKIDCCVAICHLGPAFEWGDLSPPDTLPEWFSKTGFRARQFKNKPLDFEQWQNQQSKILEQAANSGFPFASVSLTEVRLQENGRVAAKITVDSGTSVIFEQIKQEGSLQINEDFLYRFLGLQKGSIYSDALIRKVPQRLRELSFVTMKESPTVDFIGNNAILNLHLDERPASRFDFIVGVLPKSNQTGKLLVTGQLDAALQNALGHGEQLKVQFEQLRPQTQSLELQASYPYLLSLPFSLNGDFDLYRRDTNYIDLGWRLGLQYQLDGQKSIEGFWAQQQTNLLGFNEATLQTQQQLPDTLDVRRTAFGLALNFTQLDYRYNPTKGWNIRLEGSAGQKEIRKNQQIQNLGLENLYDNLQLRSAQYRMSLLAEKYFSLGGNSVVKTAVQGAIIFGEESVLANEQFRIGGNRLLRGFDEESIFAVNYLIGTLEYRFLLGTNSYLYSFLDVSRTETEVNVLATSERISDQPIGFGAGISFETRAGIFGLSLAFGKRDGLPFDFGSPKVHFGYVSLF